MVKPKPEASPEKLADQSTQDEESILKDWPTTKPSEPVKEPKDQRQTAQV